MRNYSAHVNPTDREMRALRHQTIGDVLSRLARAEEALTDIIGAALLRAGEQVEERTAKLEKVIHIARAFLAEKE